MDFISILKEHGDITNLTILEGILNPISSKGPYDKSFYDHHTYYYTSKSRSSRAYTFNLTDEIDFKIIKFINTKNMYENCWSFGFYRVVDEEGNTTWRGGYAGTQGRLFVLLKRHAIECQKKGRVVPLQVPSFPFPKPISRLAVFSKIDVDDVSAQLYARAKRLGDDLGQHSEATRTLKNYLRNLIYVVRQSVLHRETLPEGVVLQKRGRKMILGINTGFLDNWNNFIHIKVTLGLHTEGVMIEPYFIVKNIEIVNRLEDLGLTQALPTFEVLAKARVKFPEGNITIKVDTVDVQHIVEERRSRMDLPIEDKDASAEYLNECISYSVEVAKKMSQVDSSYVVPFFNMKWNKVSYLIPLYQKDKEQAGPICALVLGLVREDTWATVTSLTMEDAFTSARLLGKVNADWLKRKVE